MAAGLDEESKEISEILEDALRIWNGHNPTSQIKLKREDGAFVAEYREGKKVIATRNVLIITGPKVRTRKSHGNS